MKKILYNIIGAACMAGTLASCSDFLEIKSQNEIILEDFWKDEADVEAIIAGCYTAMQSDAAVRRMIVWGEARTDNVQTGTGLAANDFNLGEVLNENIKATNGYTSWDVFYTVINRCNTVIKYAPQVAETDPGYTQSELKAHIAEVSALRDLCYFYLMRTFRNVPYSNEAYINDDQEMALPPTDFYELLDILIADLESIQNNVVGYYSESKTGYQTGRITKAAVWSMLCEMYLWKQDYANCIKYADLVIDHMIERTDKQKTSAGVAGADVARFKGSVTGIDYPLISDFSSSSLFGYAYRNIFTTGMSQETIFELIYDKDKPGDGMLPNSATGALYGRQFISPSTAVVNDITSTSERKIFTNESQYLDSRLYENVSATGEIAKFVYKYITIDATSATNVATLYSDAYRYERKNNVDHYYSSANWIIYRLTDIMLLKAEALCQMITDDDSEEDNNIKAKAFELVEVVYKRSICKNTLGENDATLLKQANYNTKLAMENLVLAERQRELMFEGKRWYDLVRRSMRDGNTEKLL